MPDVKKNQDGTFALCESPQHRGDCAYLVKGQKICDKCSRRILEAENTRLRGALEEIRDRGGMKDPEPSDWYVECLLLQRMARDAVREQV